MKDQYENRDESDAVSYDEALEKAGYGRFQYIIIIVGGLILFSSYISVGAVAYILPAAQCDLNMDSEAKGKLVSVGFLGLIVSCHLWGFMSDTSGRRYILIRCLLLDGLLYVVTSLIPYYSVILVLRLINGFVSSGAVASLFVYVGEFITSKHRPRALMIVAMIASFQYFLTPIYAWLTISGKWKFELYPGLILKPWRLYYAVNGIPSLVCAALIFFLPESPKFLLAKGQTVKSLNILKRIHKINGKHDSEEFLVKNIKINEDEMVAKLEVGKSKVLAFVKLMWDQTVPLFKRPHRLNITLICLSQFLLYFCNGGIVLWLPETMNRLATFRYETNNEHATFCEVVQYKRNSNEINLTESQASYNTDLMAIPTEPIQEPVCNEDVDSVVYLYIGTVGLIQTINFGIIVIVSNMFDKKYIIVVYTIFSFLSSIAVEYVKVTDFAAYDSFLLIFFTGAVIPMINSLVVELFPTNLRGMAGCLTLMCCRLGTVTTNIIAGSLIDSNCAELVWCFIIAIAICVMTISIMPTKLREEKEIKHLNSVC